MRKDEIKSQLWTIPNLITYFRIICVPFIIWCTIDRNTYVEMNFFGLTKAFFPLIGFIILIAAATTDLFDGFIARKFNQATALGAALDPIADKIMHVATLLSLVIIGSVHWGFLIAILLKEGLMVLGGALLVKYSQPMKANFTGKVASVILSVGICMSFFHQFFAEKVYYLDWIAIGLAVLVTYIAFVGYLKQAIPHYKVMVKAFKANVEPNDVFERIKREKEENEEGVVDIDAIIQNLKEENN